nr:hypothetical protein [Halolamina pelagica]
MLANHSVDEIVVLAQNFQLLLSDVVGVLEAIIDVLSEDLSVPALDPEVDSATEYLNSEAGGPSGLGADSLKLVVDVAVLDCGGCVSSATVVSFLQPATGRCVARGVRVVREWFRYRLAVSESGDVRVGTAGKCQNTAAGRRASEELSTRQRRHLPSG